MGVRLALALLNGAASLLACTTVSAEDTQSVITYQETGLEAFEVYDLANAVVVFGDDSILERPPGSAEFSGPLRPCADPDYYCFTTGLHLAVPKMGYPRSWNASGTECQVLDEASISDEMTVRIRCRASAYSTVEFSFSRRQGIVSYRRICPDCYHGEFRLISARGLFASP